MYAAYTPQHHCKVREGSALNLTIPWDSASHAYSSCYVYANVSLSNGTLKCSHDVNDWDYYGDVTDTIVSDVSVFLFF